VSSLFVFFLPSFSLSCLLSLCISYLVCFSFIFTYFQVVSFLHPKRQKEPRKTIKETSGCVRPERVNKWPSSLVATWWWWSPSSSSFLYFVFFFLISLPLSFIPSFRRYFWFLFPDCLMSFFCSVFPLISSLSSSPSASVRVVASFTAHSLCTTTLQKIFRWAKVVFFTTGLCVFHVINERRD
jgi:hypothetical protein